MITEILTPVDDDCDQSLKEIQSVLSSGAFLAGLGRLNLQYSIPKGFNVITDFERCVYLLNSQQMWDEPNGDEGDQNFMDVLGDATDYLGTKTYDRPEAKRRRQYFKNDGKLREARKLVVETAKKSYERNGTAEFLLDNFQHMTPETVSRFIEYDLTSYAEACFDRFIRSAYFGGLEKWPVSKYLLRCFAIGGFPTGWVGPLPRNGGESEKCVQIIHFGSVV